MNLTDSPEPLNKLLLESEMSIHQLSENVQPTLHFSVEPDVNSIEYHAHLFLKDLLKETDNTHVLTNKNTNGAYTHAELAEYLHNSGIGIQRTQTPDKGYYIEDAYRRFTPEELDEIDQALPEDTDALYAFWDFIADKSPVSKHWLVEGGESGLDPNKVFPLTEQTSIQLKRSNAVSQPQKLLMSDRTSMNRADLLADIYEFIQTRINKSSNPPQAFEAFYLDLAENLADTGTREEDDIDLLAPVDDLNPRSILMEQEEQNGWDTLLTTGYYVSPHTGKTYDLAQLLDDFELSIAPNDKTTRDRFARLKEEIQTHQTRFYRPTKLDSANRVGDFYIKDDTLLAYIGNDDHVIVPDGITTIGAGAFYAAPSTRIDLPDTVENCDNYAFAYSNIRSINCPANELGTGVFLGCKNLQYAILRGDLTRLPNSAFKDCDNLTEILTPNVTSPLLFNTDSLKNTGLLKVMAFDNTVSFCGHTISIPTSTGFGAKERLWHLTTGLNNIQSGAVFDKKAYLESLGEIKEQQLISYTPEEKQLLSKLESWGNPKAKAFTDAYFAKLQDFQSTHPNITIDELNPTQYLHNYQKFMHSVATGKACDHVEHTKQLIKRATGAAGKDPYGFDPILQSIKTAGYGPSSYYACTQDNGDTYYIKKQGKNITVAAYEPAESTSFDEMPTAVILQLPTTLKSNVTRETFIPNTLGEGLFHNALNSDISYTVEIPDNYTNIQAGAFCQCGNIKEIQLPDSIQNIGANAFESVGVSQITLPQRAKIGPAVLWGCPDLEEVTFPEDITSLPEGCCGDCTALRAIHAKHLKSTGQGSLVNTNFAVETSGIQFQTDKGFLNIYEVSAGGYNVTLTEDELLLPTKEFQRTVKDKTKPVPATKGTPLSNEPNIRGMIVDGLNKLRQDIQNQRSTPPGGGGRT